jgi:hypothetical protein
VGVFFGYNCGFNSTNLKNTLAILKNLIFKQNHINNSRASGFDLLAPSQVHERDFRLNDHVVFSLEDFESEHGMTTAGIFVHFGGRGAPCPVSE